MGQAAPAKPSHPPCPLSSVPLSLGGGLFMYEYVCAPYMPPSRSVAGSGPVDLRLPLILEMSRQMGEGVNGCEWPEWARPADLDTSLERNKGTRRCTKYALVGPTTGDWPTGGLRSGLCFGTASVRGPVLLTRYVDGPWRGPSPCRMPTNMYEPVGEEDTVEDDGKHATRRDRGVAPWLGIWGGGYGCTRGCCPEACRACRA